ncbi:MAG: radical SAM protein, partial [Planctomycetota bacterium]
QQKSFAIAYTYNEPLMWYEYVLDTAKLTRQAGLKNVLVTNGYINPEPLNQLMPYIDALNIDIKSMDDGFYHKLCKARVNPVLETAKIARQTALVEITNLVIPG